MTQDQIQSLHALYVSLTGLNIPFTINHDWPWRQFIARGHTEDDLRVVIKALSRGIERQQRNPGCLRFRNLIADIDNFEEELAMARKVIRPKPTFVPQKAQVLRATGRADEPETAPAQPVGVILERTKLASMLGQWKAQNL